MKSKTAKNIHISLIAFLGISAIGGGGALIISPSGKLLGGLPLSLLDNSPFNDFLFPGLILFLVLGILSCFTVYALIKKTKNKWAESLNFFKDMYWAWSFSIYISFALIIWDPSGVEKMTDEIGKAVFNEMVKEGFISDKE